MSFHALVQDLTELAENVETDYIDGLAQLEDAPNGLGETLTVVYAAVREAHDALAALKRRIAKDVFAEVGYTTLQVPELGAVQVSAPKRYTKVQYDELVPRVISRLADSPGVMVDEDGALLPVHELASRLATALLLCVSMGGMKLTGVRSLGLDPDEFAEVERVPALSWKRTL